MKKRQALFACAIASGPGPLLRAPDNKKLDREAAQ